MNNATETALKGENMTNTNGWSIKKIKDMSKSELRAELAVLREQFDEDRFEELAVKGAMSRLDATERTEEDEGHEYRGYWIPEKPVHYSNPNLQGFASDEEIDEYCELSELNRQIRITRGMMLGTLKPYDARIVKKDDKN